MNANHMDGSVNIVVVFGSAQQESTKKGNMKRENKAYSFKEQIIELELQEVREKYSKRSAGIKKGCFGLCVLVCVLNSYCTLFSQIVFPTEIQNILISCLIQLSC